MSEKHMLAVLEFFPTTKWAKPSSTKYAESVDQTKQFDEQTVVEALKIMRKTLARSFINLEELLGQIKRRQRQLGSMNKRSVETFNPIEIEIHKEKALNRILLCDRTAISAAIEYARNQGCLNRSPINPDPKQWSAWTVGIVNAAIEVGERAMSKP